MCCQTMGVGGPAGEVRASRVGDPSLVTTPTTLAATHLAPWCTIPPTNTACYWTSLPAPPANASLPVGGCNATANGSTCTAACDTGYAGAPSIGCTSGSWAASWSGSCNATSIGFKLSGRHSVDGSARAVCCQTMGLGGQTGRRAPAGDVPLPWSPHPPHLQQLTWYLGAPFPQPTQPATRHRFRRRQPTPPCR